MGLQPKQIGLGHAVGPPWPRSLAFCKAAVRLGKGKGNRAPLFPPLNGFPRNVMSTAFELPSTQKQHGASS